MFDCVVYLGMENKTDKYIIYGQYDRDHEFDGTLEECREWIRVVDPKCKWYFIAHESE